MKIAVKAKDEEGNIVFEGTLTREEVGFLLQYSINDLMAAGVQFFNEQPEEEDDEDEPAVFIQEPTGGIQ